MASLLYRLGAFGARHKLAVIATWVALLGAVGGLAVVANGSFQTSTTIPGSPAQQALDAMDRLYPAGSGTAGQVVFTAAPGTRLTDRAPARALAAGLRAAGRVPGVAGVQSPAAAGQVSSDGRTAVATVAFADRPGHAVRRAELDGVRRAVAAHVPPGARVAFGGDAYDGGGVPAGATEVIGLLAALLILTVTLGSLLAAGLPILTALGALAVTVGGLVAVAAVAGVPDTGLTLAMMLGLAVGIDYALFLVSRHRQLLAEGHDVREAVATATATAGSSVVFAAATVVVALLGLTIAGIPVLTAMGLSAAAAVALAAVVVLGLLPALLAVAGTRLVPGRGSRLTRRLAARRARATGPGWGARWVGLVVRRPRRAIAACVLLLAVLAAPLTQLRLASTDAGSAARGSGPRVAYDRIARAFGPGANGPLVVLLRGRDARRVATAAAALATRVAREPGVAAVLPPQAARGAAASRLVVFPTTGPSDAATSALAGRLQRDAAPLATAQDASAVVTGRTAVDLDLSRRLGDATLPFAIVVVGLSILLLTVAFRSVAIPVKATAGFLLSVGAALGLTVAVFQWGWLADVLSVSHAGPVASFTPTIVMAVLFGLAMDYEVFLVSSMREAYRRDGDASAAIVAGASGAARIVGAAALIMIVVFASFLTIDDPDIKPIAFGLAVGVVLDAFVVRMTLVPALLQLLGDRAWRLPRRLERLVPDLDLEGERLHRRPRREVAA